VAGNAFDYQSEFVKADGEVGVQVQWMSAKKREGEITFAVYDLDNRVLMQAKPEKVKVPAGRAFLTNWKLPLARLEPGVYRVDVLLGPAIVSRSFLTLRE
jgi:uncharacterized protein (DUF2141 family)